jgi:hypothetical protein
MFIAGLSLLASQRNHLADGPPPFKPYIAAERALIDGNLESVRHRGVAAAREFLRAEDKEGLA